MSSYVRGAESRGVGAIASWDGGLGATRTANLIWVPPSGGKPGFFRRARAGETPTKQVAVRTRTKAESEALRKQRVTAAMMEAAKKSTVREQRPQVLAEECIAAGVPQELVPLCVEGRQSGASIEEVIEELQNLSPEELAEITGGAVAAPKKSPNLLLIGGLAAAGLAAVLILRKKKRS